MTNNLIYFQALEHQLKLSECLKEALAVAKVCDSPEVEQQMAVLKARMEKVEALFKKRTLLIEEKKNLLLTLIVSNYNTRSPVLM